MTPQERGMREGVALADPPVRTSPAVQNRRVRVGVAVLGLDAWVVALFLPLLLAGAEFPKVALSTLVLVPLAAGLALYPRWAPEVFLGVFPCALIISVGVYETWAGDRLHDAVSLSLAAGALALHVLGVTSLVRVAPSREVGVRPLSEANHTRVGQAARRARLRGLVVTVATLGAFAILLLAPRVLGVLEFDRAETTRTLVASVSVVLATVILIGFVAPATRRARSIPAARRSGRVILLLSAAVMGAGVYWLLQGR